MRISLVVAASTNHVIGRNGELPWHISEDLKHFKRVTLGHPIIMGRRTYESIGRPLPGRLNIVLSSQPHYTAAGCQTVNSPAGALRAAGEADDVMVIGGGQVYALFLPMADRIFITRVDTQIEGDAFFPTLDPDEWRLVEEQEFPRAEGQEYAFRFQTLQRVAGPTPISGAA